MCLQCGNCAIQHIITIDEQVDLADSLPQLNRPPAAVSSLTASNPIFV